MPRRNSKGRTLVLQFCRPQVFTAPAVDNDRKAKPPCIDIFPGLKLTCEAFKELPDKPGQQAAFYFYIGSRRRPPAAKDSTLNTFKTKLGNQACKIESGRLGDFPAGTKTWRKLRYTGSQEFCVKDKGGTETFRRCPASSGLRAGGVGPSGHRRLPSPLSLEQPVELEPVAQAVAGSVAQEMSLDALREEVCNVNRRLPAAGLVTMHSGNASGLDRQSGRLLIKPSGVDYDALRPGDLVEVELESGRVTGGKLRPSVDLPHHLFLYRRLPDVAASSTLTATTPRPSRQLAGRSPCA